MLQPFRTLISLAFVAGIVWFTFSVPLGGRTLAQHIDRIGQTREARELLDGARETVNPALEEARDRVLGEHVEAPTRLPAPGPALDDGVTPARTVRVGVSTEANPRLPGQPE